MTREELLAAIENIEHLQVATVQPGDVLVVRLRGHVGPEVRARVDAVLRAIWPETRCLVLDDEAELGIVRAEKG